MRVFGDKRATGKTTKILHVSEFEHAVILCENEASKTCIQDKAERLHLNIPEPMTINDLLSHKHSSVTLNECKIIIDDLENVLHKLCETYGFEFISGAYNQQDWE